MSRSQNELLRMAAVAYRDGQFYLAFDLYKEAADNGSSQGQVFVAWMLSRGIGCVRNEAEAARYYERAAALGNADGSFYFGRWLTRAGEHTRAFGFYLHGARNQHLPSMFRVGHSFARGKGIEIDHEQAYQWLTAAARRGHAYALRELAILDLRCNRGVLLLPLGILEFLVALCWGVLVSIVNAHSDRIRG